MYQLRRFPRLILAVCLLCAWTAGSARALAQPANPSQTMAPAADQPDPFQPADGAHTTGATDPPLGVPTFSWAPGDLASRYHIQVSTSAGFSSTVVDKDTYTTSFTPEIALADGVYYWRVKAYAEGDWGAYSDVWSFEKDWTDAGALVPALLSPPYDAERAAFAHEDFSWTPVPGAASYRFEISTDPAFSSTDYSVITIKAHHTPTQRLSNNVYYWRVTPIDRKGNNGGSSQVGSFRFNWNLVPTLIGPEHGAELTYLPQFSWTAVEAAKQYRLEISTQPDFGASLSAYLTDNTDYTPERALGNDQDYYWRVQAIDYRGNNGPFSAVRRFRIRWNFQTQLLTPRNNSIRMSYPCFSWTPIPGAERYEIQIDESTSFDTPIADEKIYNATAWAQPRWSNVTIDGDYFWRVRGIDAQGNLTPWSKVTSFRPSYETSPTQVYPPYYYAADEANLPVHTDSAIAWPLFIWDTAHIYDMYTGRTQGPDYYELTVDDDPSFASPNFRIETAGNAAAPTTAHPFTPLVAGHLYYWRVRAYLQGQQMGTDSVWLTRYDPAAASLPTSATLTPIYPADAFEAVAAAPPLGWLPLTGATRYRVEVSRNRDFTDVVDWAETEFVNYVPWQGQRQPMPFGTYWWRVRSESPLGAWSEVRHFNLSVDVIAGNKYDLAPPPAPSTILSYTVAYTPTDTFVAASPAEPVGGYDLDALHVMLDRTYTGNYNWVIAFESAATAADALLYGLYFDTDHQEGSGAGSDPRGKPISTDPLYRPEYVLYVNRDVGDGFSAANASFYRWNGGGWDPPQTLADIGGDVWYEAGPRAVQLLLPYTAIGSADPDFAGSVALTIFSTGASAADGVRDSVPEQSNPLDSPAFVSDMLMPLYPFDTPFSNPIVLYNMPALRWRMPYADSVDGYQVQVARDASFTQLVETWETYESNTWSYFALLPAAFQSKNAYEDNESYYWRVRIRHERYDNTASHFDYGPWSPAMRFKLDSLQVGRPTLSTGDLAQMTPTFSWDRVEGAAGYTLQVDNDANFSSPLINKRIDGTSYTPTNALQDGTYYWRVAMRRSYAIEGHWTPTMSFVKSSLWPIPLSPINDASTVAQPTFTWASVLTPTVQPRMAAPRYRVQIARDPSFSNAKTYDTEATSYTQKKGFSLADGTWHWRVGILDADNHLGTYSPTQRFYKEYLPPTLLWPEQGGVIPRTPSFEWTPLAGAAYYKFQIADNELFNRASSATTDNTRFTPTHDLGKGTFYWRVQMYDLDNNPGPLEVGRVYIGSIVHLPFITQ